MRYVLDIDNFLTIEKLRLELAPGAHGFAGENAQGKTNILLALEELLKGTGDGRKIRDGAEKATIRLDAFDGGDPVASVRRTFSGDKTKVEADILPDGETPASYLSRVLDEVAVNPIRMLSDDPVAYLKRQVRAKLTDEDLAPIRAVAADVVAAVLPTGPAKRNGFAVCEKIAEKIGEERLVAGRDAKNAEAVLADFKKGLPERMPEKPAVSVEDIDSCLATIKNDLAVAAEKIRNRDAAEARRDHARAELEKTFQGIAELERGIERLRAGQDQAALRCKDAEAELAALPMVDVAGLRTAASSFEDKRVAAMLWQSAADRMAAVEAKKADLIRLRDHHAALDGAYKLAAYGLPMALLSRADLGVPGLTFEDGDLYLDGRHASRLSTAERALLASKLAISLAKAKGHIAVCLDGVEHLDAARRAEFLRVAEESGLCVLYTRVGAATGDEATVKNGEVTYAAE